ncbi:MAG TPA: polysaccharide biosynthesis tyrosine autokinase [Nevskiales bacterium]|nr:polysaccharide biosynthesis tyrosine autokinase [Nevskiales bacterium]
MTAPISTPTGAPWAPARETQSGAVIPLTEVVEILQAGKYWVLASLLAFLLLGIAYIWVKTPHYATDATIQLERQKSLLGQNSPEMLWWGGQPQSSAEMEIIRSRGVIGAVVRQLNLDIVVRPRYFPVVGAAIARHSGRPGVPGEAPLGFRRYAWRGERIRVDRLSVPVEMEGQMMTLVTGAQGAYRLLDKDGNELLGGRVGLPARAELDGGGAVEIFVSELKAYPGTQFRLAKLPFDDVVHRLRKQLRLRETDRQSGIIQIALGGADAQRTADILNAIVQAYVRQNVERQSEEAAKMLEFVNSQLPALKAQVDTAEAALKDYRTRSGGAGVDLTIEAQAVLARLAEVDKQISLLNLERSELRQRYTDQHPLVVSLQDKLRSLEQTRASIEGQIKQMPDTEWQSVRLVRDVKVATALYTELLNKGQELKVSRAGTIGNVRIVDPAVVPRRPAAPNPGLVLAVCLFLGLVVGVGYVFLRRMLRRTLGSPDVLEQALGLPIYSTIPHSRAQQKLARSLSQQARREGELMILSKAAPQDSAVEGLRSLRTSLQFASLDSSNKVIAIHGPTPALGKSFLSVNLAYLLAETGKKVLLVDGDMRKGHLQEACSVSREPGLSECLAGSVPLADAIKPLDGGKLDLLATGTLPPNPSELLMHDRFGKLLAEASQRYDHIIIDCPPVLNLADAVAIGRQAGANFMVVRAGVSTLDDVRFAVGRLAQNRIKLDGLLFNDLSANGARRAYSVYYGTEYSAARS